MARGGDELYAEAPEVPANGVQHVHIRLTSIAPTSADFPQFERTAKRLHELLVERGSQAQHLGGMDDQVGVLSDRETVNGRVANGPGRKGLETIGAEQTTTQSDARLAIDADRLR